MPKADDIIERALFGLAQRTSGGMMAAIAVVLYGGLGLALPLLSNWSVSWLVAANVTATTLAGLLILVWLVVQVQAANRRHLVEWTTDLRRLDSAEFEWLVGEVFRREGWTVAETGRRDGPDGNIDLRLAKDGQRSIVQCKRWSSWLVDVDEVRKFAGTLVREGLPSRAGIFVTLSDFTTQAREEANTMGLTLVDNRDFDARVEKVRRKEACPDLVLDLRRRLNRPSVSVPPRSRLPPCDAGTVDRDAHGNWWVRGDSYSRRRDPVRPGPGQGG